MNYRCNDLRNTYQIVLRQLFFPPLTDVLETSLSGGKSTSVQLPESLYGVIEMFQIDLFERRNCKEFLFRMKCSRLEFTRGNYRLRINQVYDGQCLMLFQVAGAIIKTYQVLKYQSSLHHCQNALLIFNSRKVQMEKAQVTQVFNSLTTAIDTNNGETVAAVLFLSGTTVKSQVNCECETLRVVLSCNLLTYGLSYWPHCLCF